MSVRPHGQGSYYAALGVAPTATIADIKQAYYAKSKVLHPDVNSDENAEEEFIEVTKAYHVLSDVNLRRRYDQGIDVPLSRPQPQRDHEASAGMHNARRQGPLNYHNAQFDFAEFYRKHYEETRQYDQLRRKKQEDLARVAAANQRTHERIVSVAFVLLIAGMFLVR